MTKTIKTSMNFRLIILSLLGILAFGAMVLMPMSAKAVCFDNYSGGACSGDSGSGTYSYASYNNGYNYNANNLNPAPAVYQVTPNSIPANVTGNIVITLSGYNFIPNSLAEFNNSFRPTRYRDSTHLDVTLNDNDLHTIGSYVITVFNPMPGGGMSNGVAFNVNSGAYSNANVVYNNSYNPVVVSYNKPKTVKVYQTTPVVYQYQAAPNIAPAQPNYQNTIPVAQTNNGSDSYGSLTANAIFGAKSFAPSGIIQWIVFAILLLVIIVLTRRVFGFNAKYQKVPLKHA